MANVFDIANFFIDIAIKTEDDFVTNLKLNKLIYYAQGAYLARTGKPLFNEDIEAWQYGPVIPCVYQKYKDYSSSPITKTDDDYSASVFSKSELAVLLDVMREFGIYTGSKLVSLTHKSDTPWSKAYTNKKDIIPLSDITEYFKQNPVKEFKISSNIPTVSKLPKDWYAPEEDAIWESYLQ